jgi:hypothetical protein
VLFELAFGVDAGNGKQARPVVVEVGVEVAAVELVELRSPTAGDVLEA